MQRIIIVFIISISLQAAQVVSSNPVENKSLIINSIFENKWDLSKTYRKYLNQYKVIVKSNVSNNEKSQTMKFKVAAMHKRSCAPVLDKLSRYEDYSQYMDFVTKSKYLEKKQKVYFLLESPILPFKMSLSFKIPRIKKPGKYPFEFQHGIFKGLTGTIEVHQVLDECLFFTHANWIGKKTSIPNVIIEMFSETLTRKSFEKLFRITKF